MAARKTPAELGRFLLTRGLWLIGIEVFVVATAWSFAPRGIEEVGGLVVVPMQVIWAIGASMVVLAAVQFLGQRASLVIGGLILLSHNLLDLVWPTTGGLFDTSSPAWVVLQAQSGVVVGPFHLAFVYPILPWIGVILTGFGAASLFRDSPEKRDARLFRWGAALTGAFLLLRGIGLYGDPNAWEVHPGVIATLIDFLNVTKYPPSLLFLLMTLGPAAILCSYADRIPRWVTAPLIVFGRAPFAFYVAHLYFVHALAVGFGAFQGFDPRQFFTFSFFFPEGYGVGLPGVYLVWVLVIPALYPLCRWVASVKRRRKDWWLSYL
jgi:uncharacterized membrane protein